MVRGLELQKGNIFKKVRNFIPIIIPLIILSIQRAMVVAESLESRGFGATKKRTYLYPLKMKKKDYIIIILLFILLIFVIWVLLAGNLPSWMLFQIPF
jgi:energy-coupling factor transport system permease protein